MVWLGLASVLVVSLACENGLGGPAAATSTPTEAPATALSAPATSTPTEVPATEPPPPPAISTPTQVPATEPPAPATSTPTQVPVTESSPPATSTPSTAVSISDRDTLAALYEATDGVNWLDNSNWLSDAPIDEWHGVTTYGSGRVTELGLSDNQLSGEIPTWLGNLTNLKLLALQGNQLNGEIPTELSNLANLEVLYLDGNQLSGEIPPELGNLTNLEDLDLHNNQLSGEIPPELGNLTNLENLNLHGNLLSGKIPPELGNLTNLNALDLRNNQLSGEIPPELGNLVNLWELYLAHNQLTGHIPARLRNVPLNDLARVAITLPEAPTGLTAAGFGLKQVDLWWTAPASDGGAAITGYRIEASEDGSNWSVLSADTGSDATSTSHIGLTGEISYHYRISAINAAGTGPWSATTTAFKRKPSEEFDVTDAPFGMWSDGVTMWVLHHGQIYAYVMATKARVPGEDFKTLGGNLFPRNSSPENIWSDGETMWVSDSDRHDPRIYAYDMTTKKRDSRKDFDTLTLEAAGNDDPQGIWSNVVRMWVLDGHDRKIYAYDMTSKERVPLLDFETLDAGNVEPGDIWSDGVTMWVLDGHERKIYAYDMATQARVPGKGPRLPQSRRFLHLAARHLVRRG